MLGPKEIRQKISTIKNTKKITNALEKVAVSKMRKIQIKMNTSYPYVQHIRKVINNLTNANPEYRHSFMRCRTITKCVGYIVISSDRGLCGGLNINLFKLLITNMKMYTKKGVQNNICSIGKKGSTFFSMFGGNIVAANSNIGEIPILNDIIGSVKIMLDLYNHRELDSLFIVYNKFINTMCQNPTIEQLIPLVATEDNTLKHYWDYIYEPDAKFLLDFLLQRYIESVVYHSVIENKACENAARMIAMKNATDNADELINNFKIIYNKSRQSEITQELSEIVGGASAL